MLQVWFKRRVNCPLCDKSVVDISRHMKSKIHGWSAEQAKYARANLGLRKRKAPLEKCKFSKLICNLLAYFIYNNITIKYYFKILGRKYVTCPTCDCQVVRLEEHIRNIHTKEKLKQANETVKNTIIENYKVWLESIDSGGLTKATATRCLTFFQSLYEEEDFGSLKRILDENKIRIYFEGKIHKNVWERSSAGTYLYNMVTFYRYLTFSTFKTLYRNNKNIFSMSYEDIKDQSTELKEKAKAWAKAFVNENNPDKEEKYINDMQNLLTKEDRKKIKYGSVAKEVEALMDRKNLQEEEIVSKFLIVRNFVIGNIFARNAHRSVVLYNFTVKEFERHTEKDGLIFIHVKDHKTKKTQGLASVVIDVKFFEIMKFYFTLRNMLLQLREKTSDHFFISRSGSPLDASTMNSSLQTFLKSLDIRKHVTATTFRRGAHSSVTDETKRRDMSNLLMHSEATGRIHYDRSDKEESRIRAYNELNKEENDDHAEDTVVEEHVEGKGNDSSVDIEPDEYSGEEHASGVDESNSSVQSGNLLNYPPCNQGDQDSELLNDDGTARVIEKKIHRRKLELSESSDDGSTEDEHDFDIDHIMSKMKRTKLFTVIETRTMLSVFKEYLQGKKIINTSSIKNECKRPEAKILRKFQPMQIDTRLRYIKKLISVF